MLLPVDHQIAISFAEMHDRPARMVAKRVLRGVVPWAEARAFFAARLRRRLAEEAMLRHIAGEPGQRVCFGSLRSGSGFRV